MKTIFGTMAAAAVLCAALAGPAGAASLLGGLIGTGSDSGNGSGLVSNNSNGSIGVGGSNGVSVNPVSLTGGLGGSGSTGVPGVADVSGSGTNYNVNLLGGGGTNFGVPLGSDGGLNFSLPGFGGTNGGPGGPGAPGTNGGNGYGYNGYNGYNGASGGGFYVGNNVSGRLRGILAMLAQRNWIRMVNGRAICLGNFGTAEISSVLPSRDWAGLNAALPQYAQDIATLRQLLANCRSSQQRQALNARDLNRVIGIGVGQGGQPIVYML